MLLLADHYMVRNVNSLVQIICKESGMQKKNWVAHLKLTVYKGIGKQLTPLPKVQL